MPAVFINDLVRLYCLRHQTQTQTQTQTHPSIDQTAYMDA